ncbi:hypothetical protein ACHAW6_000009 [Cyclotella cf. meneghiniana]
MAADALAAYPDHDKQFDVYTDASNFQLGACTMQDGRPVAYFSRKLNKAQKHYTTMEKELLSIVATLEEFRSMLLSADIHIFTDHKNLTFNDLKTQLVLQWCNKIEEFTPWLHYFEGKKNIIAENLSYGRNVEFNALTCIDTASNHVDLVRMDNKHHCTYAIDSCSCGLHDIHDLHDVSTTKVVNSSVKHSNVTSDI